jgi:hypothetical protein
MTLKNVQVSSAIVTVSNARMITQKGVYPAASAQVICITISNRSEQDLNWVNATLGTPHNYRFRKPNTDTSDGYVETRTGYEAIEVQFGPLKRGETKTVTYHRPWSAYDVSKTIGDWTCYRVYGQAGAGQTFENWVKGPVAFGVAETKTKLDSSCFIATAAYQDPDHPMVQQLRFVRDEILSRSRPGRRFTAWYYRNGPRLAAVVRPRPALRLTARAILTPIARSVQASRSAAGFWRRAPGPKL